MTQLNDIQEVADYLKVVEGSKPEPLKRNYSLGVPGVSPEQLKYLESNVGKLPDSFSKFISGYNLSMLNLKGLKFHVGLNSSIEDYVNNLVISIHERRHPFQNVLDNQGLIEIGSYEQDSLVLDLKTGDVGLFLLDDQRYEILAKSLHDLLVHMVNAIEVSNNQKSFETRVEEFRKYLKSNQVKWNDSWNLISTGIFI